MTDDHKMRAECGIQFGAINKELGAISKELEFHKEWRDEQRATLLSIQKEVEKLTGNGNRGRIDTLGDQISEISSMLVSHLPEAQARDQRIALHEHRLDKIETRLYSVAIVAAGLSASLVPIAKWVMEKL